MTPAATGSIRPERLDILDASRGLQWAFARWWLARHAYGPLEWLWRAATLRVTPWPLPPRAVATAGASR